MYSTFLDTTHCGQSVATFSTAKDDNHDDDDARKLSCSPLSAPDLGGNFRAPGLSEAGPGRNAFPKRRHLICSLIFHFERRRRRRQGLFKAFVDALVATA